MKCRTPAIVVQGHQVASGQSNNDCFVKYGGTLGLQASLFKDLGLDLDAYFQGDLVYGTINLSVDAHAYEILRPTYRFMDIRWTDELDVPGQEPYTESFFLDPASIITDHREYKALLYIPV